VLFNVDRSIILKVESCQGFINLAWMMPAQHRLYYENGGGDAGTVT
jgi:hypothetical protein